MNVSVFNQDQAATPRPSADQSSKNAAQVDESVSQMSNDVESQPLLPQKPGEISIDEAIELLGMGKFQLRILIAAGLCFAADAMEISLLSFLQVVLQAQWKLSNGQAATITSVVLLGQIFGALVLGYLGDRVGRKPAFTTTAIIICFFGFATASASNLWWIVFFRFMVGVGVGGLTVPFDTLSEFLPNSNRGMSLLLSEYFWTAGTLRKFKSMNPFLDTRGMLLPFSARMDDVKVVPLVALLTLGPSDTLVPEEDKWRYFVALCAVPCLLSTIACVVFVPESPRWLLANGKHDQTMEVLRRAAKCNNKNPMQLFPPNTRLYQVEEKTQDFFELLSPAWRKTSILLWLTWAGMGFCFFGTVMVITYIFARESADGTYSFDYAALWASASAEVAGTTLAIFVVDTFGRVPCQVVSFISAGACTFVLCTLAAKGNAQRIVLILFSFLVRMFFLSGGGVTWIATAEILTTDVRTRGHSVASAVNKVCGAVTPFIVTKDRPLTISGSAILAAGALAALSASHLPETKGRNIGLKLKD